MSEFEGVVPALAQALSKRGYSELTPVQQAVLAPELAGADMLVSAQTGSGKTVAFGLAFAPTLLEGKERFERATAPLALVVAPTRELALQVKRELEWLYAPAGVAITSCVGGMDIRTERRALERGAHIVVGTPGRLCDHIRRNAFDTSALRAVVLDEADEMLDLGFREDLEFILDAAPVERRTLMFSATVPRNIASLAKRYQRDAVRVTTTEETKQHVDIEYRALTIGPRDQENAIINVLRYYEAKNALVFCATRATVNHMLARFANRGFSVVALSGELSQSERTHALQAMRDGRAKVCVATDVAARGIDLPNLELVIHADLPKNPESLLHRSGRTGRAGRKGVSALIVPHNARRRTERLLQNAKIQAVWASPPSIEEVALRDNERLLADPSLTEPLKEAEYDFAHELVERHGPEQVAAAFVRLYRAGRSAPEELADVAPFEAERKERQARQRDDFAGSIWFSLSIGHKQAAEPRWLLPMLCKVGGLTKRDIGAIRIDQNETYVEIAPKGAERFQKALGPGETLEKSIRVKRLDSKPDMAGGAGEPRGNKKPYGAKKPYKPGGHKSGGKYPPRDKPNYSKNKYAGKQTDTSPDAKPGYPKDKHAGKPREASAETRSDTSGDKEGGKPWENKSRKPGGKKPFKPKFSKGGANSGAGGKPGVNPKKRKKPRKPRQD